MGRDEEREGVEGRTERVVEGVGDMGSKRERGRGREREEEEKEEEKEG